MPMALSFSPDGQKLAVGAWTYVSKCEILATYYVDNADASDLRALPVASLAALGGTDQQMVFFGDGLAWTPESDGLWVKGQVKDCFARTKGTVSTSPS